MTAVAPNASSTPLQIVMIGATGLVGSCTLPLLVRAPVVSSITVLSRRNPPLESPKLETALFSNLSELSSLAPRLEPRVRPGSVWICTLGTTLKDAGSREAFRTVDETAVLDFARLAQSLGAQRFILVSAMGANPNSRIFYNQVKGRVEAELEKMQFPELVIFQPGLLLGEREIGPHSKKRWGEHFAVQFFQKLRPFLPPSWIRSVATEVSALSQAIVSEATRARSHSKKVLAKQITST